MNLTASMRMHHFGLAAKDEATSCSVLRKLGYSVGQRVRDELQRTDLVWCTREGEPAVEVVLPFDDESPLKTLLAAQGTSFYHLCFETQGTLENAGAEMRTRGMRMITVREPLPAVLFGGRRVSFHVVHGFGLIELLEGLAEAPAS